MVRRTKEEAQATRKLILDTAEVVFHEQGVSRSTLNEIAQAAGLTRGAIYWHFKDKADLFNAMMDRVTLPLEETAYKSDDEGLADPVAFMRDNFIHALRLTVESPQVRRVFEIATHKVEYVDETKAVRDRHLAIRDKCLAHAQRGISLAIRRGLLPKRIPAKAAAIGLHALIDGLIQNWMLDPEAFDLVKTGQQVLDTYLAGLAVPGDQ
ncbi:TetR family transcriptional regulator [Piscinibacter sp. HJYY11]|uniref:TetR family transcriptional regulator n=1 Tax=Piscinibacter sp. HJYY11 TaxID=2801333 RepID=UPI00191F7011|nr:TetR family transcriptional regulator [Piscinibacter sp. HJYY11]MBL0729500.1 TetR family transcriptional regulator [Piscinibacter sp. HJYY11]